MKTGKLIVFIISLLLIAFCVSGALANDDVIVDVVDFSPLEMEGSGKVDVTIEVSNNSNYELTDISVTPSNDDLPDVVVPCPGTAKIQVSFNMKGSQLGKPFPITVEWLCDGEPQSDTVEITVERTGENNPVIEIDSAFSRDCAKPGSDMTVTYTISNRSKFDMTDIMVTDPGISSDPVLKNISLKANKTESFDYDFKMGKQEMVSSPSVTFVVAGKAYLSPAEEEVKVSLANISLIMEISVRPQDAHGTDFVLNIQNNGNQDMYQISIRDDLGNLINTQAFDLTVGSSHSMTYTVENPSNATPRNVSFKLTAMDAFNDNFELPESDPVTVQPFVDDSQINVSLDGNAEGVWDSETGSVKVRLVIENSSTTPLKNVRLSEASNGDLQNYDVLSGGQTVYENYVKMSSPGYLYFELKGTDAVGSTRTLDTCAVSVVGESGSAWGTSNNNESDGKSGGLFGNGISRIVIILIAVVVMGLAVLFILTIIEKGRSEGLRDIRSRMDALDSELDQPPERLEEDGLYPDDEPLEFRKAKKRMSDGVKSLLFEEKEDFDGLDVFEKGKKKNKNKVFDDEFDLIYDENPYSSTDNISLLEEHNVTGNDFSDDAAGEKETVIAPKHAPKVINVKQEAREQTSHKNAVKRVKPIIHDED